MASRTGLTAAAALAAILVSHAAPAADGNTPTAPGVVVSASRIAVPAKEIGSAVTVVTGEELEQRQVRVLSDVFRDIPGLAVSRNGPIGGLTQLRMRGAEANQTLVLIDGIEVNNPAAGSEFNFAGLLATDIERVEVLRGPQSALYGSDAIGGVVNIITAKPGRGLNFGARVEGGSFATQQGSTSIGYGHERFYVSGLVDHLRTKGISVADEDAGNPEADGFENTSVRVKAGATPIEGLALDVVGIRTRGHAESDTDAAMVNFIDGGDETRTIQNFGSAKATFALYDGMWEHILRAIIADTATEFLGAFGPFISEGRKYRFDYQTNFKFTTPNMANAEHGVSLTFEHEDEEQFTNSTFSGPNRVDIMTYGYAADYRIGLWDKLFLSASFRFDDNDPLFDNEVTYRATAAYVHEQSATRFHGSAGRGVKNPSLFELFGSTPTFTGNTALTAEQAFGWDIGVEQALLDDMLILDAAFFRTRITNLIDGGGSTAVNLAGDTRIKGVELVARAKPTKDLAIEAAYTFTDARDPAGGRLIRRAGHIASVNARYDASDLVNRPAQANVGLRFNGPQNDTVFESFFPVARRTVTLGGFALLNLGASVQVVDGVDVFVRGENLLDQNYQEVFGVGSQGVAGYAGVRIRLGPK